jgi:hypothetical protein
LSNSGLSFERLNMPPSSAGAATRGVNQPNWPAWETWHLAAAESGGGSVVVTVLLNPLLGPSRPVRQSGTVFPYVAVFHVVLMIASLLSMRSLDRQVDGRGAEEFVRPIRVSMIGGLTRGILNLLPRITVGTMLSCPGAC